MLFTEWNWDDAKEVWQEEAREETWEKAQKKLRKSAMNFLLFGRVECLWPRQRRNLAWTEL